MTTNNSLFDDLGGRPTLEKVHKVFYDKLYEHPWMKHFFTPIDQQHIEKQQTDFMSSKMGGPNVYAGKFPKEAHSHMNIPAEMFELRTSILEESIRECGICAELAQKWIQLDGLFRAAVVKDNVSQCTKRFFTDEILDFKKP